MIIGPSAIAELLHELVLALDPVRLGVDQGAVHVPEHRTRQGAISGRHASEQASSDPKPSAVIDVMTAGRGTRS